MRYPQMLKEGGVIEFTAPAFGISIEPYISRFRECRRLFEEAGYKLLDGENVYSGSGIGISDTPEVCAKDLVRSYVNQDSDAVISCGGGELMCETISHVDFDAVKLAQPKWYMGYSDNTNFTFLLTTLCDVASIYGYCATTFGRTPWHVSQDDSIKVLSEKSITLHNYEGCEDDSTDDEAPCTPIGTSKRNVIHGFIPGNSVVDITYKDVRNESEVKIRTRGVMLTNSISFSGRIIGGCLDCLVNLCGTRFDQVKEFADKYADDGLIWYVESCDLNVYDMRRAMWHLYEAGWFKNIKGLIIGRPMHHEEMFGLNRFDAYLEVVSKLKVPVIFDADIGHVPPMMPMINGAFGDVRFKDGCLDIDMKLR